MSKEIVSVEVNENHLLALLNYLKGNNLAVDEIIIKTTDIETGKHNKIKLVKTFEKYIKKLTKKLKKDKTGKFKEELLSKINEDKIITKNKDGFLKINEKGVNYGK